MSRQAAQAVIHDVHNAGMAIEADGGQLVLKPAKRLTAELASRIKAHKADILYLVSGEYWHERSDRNRFAISDQNARAGMLVYQAIDPPISEPETAHDAAVDALILSYACLVRLKILKNLGDCPGRYACDIRDYLQQALAIVDEAAERHSAAMPEVERQQRKETRRLFEE